MVPSAKQTHTWEGSTLFGFGYLSLNEVAFPASQL